MIRKSLLGIIILLNIAAAIYLGFLAYSLSAWPLDILEIDFSKNNFYWLGLAVFRVIKLSFIFLGGAIVIWVINKFLIQIILQIKGNKIPIYLLEILSGILILMILVGGIQFFVTGPFFSKPTVYDIAIEQTISIVQDGRLGNFNQWNATDNPFGEGLIVFSGTSNNMVFFVNDKEVFAISEDAYEVANRYSNEIDYYGEIPVEDLGQYINNET